MAFPTIPTTGNGRIVTAIDTTGLGSRQFSDPWSGLTFSAGNLVIAVVVTYQGNSTNAEFSSWSHSLTEFTDQAATTTMAVGCAYKFASGSESGNLTVNTADGSAADGVLFLMSFSDAHGSAAPEAGAFGTGTGAAATPGTVFPSWGAADTLWIWVGGSGETNTAGSFTGIGAAPTNYSSYLDTGISADVVGGVEGAIAFRQLNASSEAAGASASVDVSNARNMALMIAVRPPAAGSTYTKAGFGRENAT